MKRLLVLFVIVFSLSGCSKHCIRLAGNYKGIDGELEYCLDLRESQKEGTPVLTSGDTKIYSFSAEDLKKIRELVSIGLSKIIKTKEIGKEEIIKTKEIGKEETDCQYILRKIHEKKE